MILITKAEKDVVEKRVPDAHIVRTMRQHSERHHYYCEETSKTMHVLDQLRGGTDEKKGDRRRGYKEKKR